MEFTPAALLPLWLFLSAIGIGVWSLIDARRGADVRSRRTTVDPSTATTVPPTRVS